MATTPRKLSAQGSCSVRVLKTGDNIFISLKSDKGLAQGWNSTTKSCIPDWGKASEQPTITPEVTSTQGVTVTLKNHHWSYNGIALTFDTTTNKSTNTGYEGWFEINPTAATCTLKIIHNLADEKSLGGSTIEYGCTAVVDGAEYNGLKKSVDITIQQLGDSGYMATLTTNTTQLTPSADRNTTILYPRLFTGGGEVEESAFWVQYYKDDQAWGDAVAGYDHPVVTRNDVDGEQLFIAYFFIDSGSVSDKTKAIAQAAIRITDTADSYHMVTEISSVNKEVAPDKPVTVTSRVVKISDGTEPTLSNAVWDTRVYAKNDFTTPLKQSNTNTIEVTYADTLTSAGTHEDVEVLCEVEWGLATLAQTNLTLDSSTAIAHPMDNFGYMSANAAAFSP